FLEHTLTYALIEIANRQATAVGLHAESIYTQRAALIALDQMDDTDLKADTVIAYLDSKQPLLKDTAYWIVSHHADWGDQLAKYFRKTPPDAERLAALAKSTAIQDLIADMVHTKSCDIAFKAMAGAGV